MLLYGGVRVIDHAMPVGVLVTFLLYLRQVLRAAAGRVAVLQHVPVRRRGAGEAVRRAGGAAVGAGAGEPGAAPRRPGGAGPGRQLELSSIRFGYRDAVVLPRLNLTIPAGQTVALVGATGAGKTTIARLMARFYDPDEGQVLLDGVDLRAVADADLRREVILITQENFLFSASIAENIELGKPGASRPQIEAAARAVGAGEFIMAMPRWLRHRGRQARRPAVGRPAPADLVRQGVPRRAERADPGRGDLAARPAERADRPAGAADRAGRPDRGDHRAPAVDGAGSPTACWCSTTAR